MWLSGSRVKIREDFASLEGEGGLRRRPERPHLLRGGLTGGVEGEGGLSGHTCYQTVGTHMLPNCWYAVDSLVGFTLPIARSVGVTRQILTLEIDSKRPTDL